MPGRRIREDHRKYRNIIRDKVKNRLKEYIKTGKKIERRGKDLVVVDIPVIELPKFRYGNPIKDGIGAGPGEIGDEVGDGPPQGDEKGKAGKNPGEHTMGVGVTVDDYIDILGEELQLPHLKPKQNSEIVKPKVKYNKIAKVGNNSLLHKKRTLKNAMKRLISTSDYDPENPDNLYPINEDKEYKSWDEVDTPDINAVIMFMADISASMDDSKRDLIREMCWYLESWIKKFYDTTLIKYIVHDVEAEETDQEKFYNYTSGGGTKISSAFSLVNDMIDNQFPLDEWNIYCFYLSDGENWSDDNNVCIKYMETLQKKCNIIGVSEVKGQEGWAEFLLSVEYEIDKGQLDPRVVVTASIDEHEDILRALQGFLDSAAE